MGLDIRDDSEVWINDSVCPRMRPAGNIQMTEMKLDLLIF